MLNPLPSYDKTVAALSGTPMLLVLVLLNLCGLVTVAFLIYFSAQLRFRERAELVAALRACVLAQVERPALPSPQSR